MAREFRFSALTTGTRSSSYAAVLKEPVQGLFPELDDRDHWKPAASALLRLADDFVFLGLWPLCGAPHKGHYVDMKIMWSWL